MKKNKCVNGDGRPVKYPSKILCAECLKELDKKIHLLLKKVKKNE